MMNRFSKELARQQLKSLSDPLVAPQLKIEGAPLHPHDSMVLDYAKQKKHFIDFWTKVLNETD